MANPRLRLSFWHPFDFKIRSSEFVVELLDLVGDSSTLISVDSGTLICSSIFVELIRRGLKLKSSSYLYSFYKIYPCKKTEVCIKNLNSRNLHPVYVMNNTVPISTLHSDCRGWSSSNISIHLPTLKILV